VLKFKNPESTKHIYIYKYLFWGFEKTNKQSSKEASKQTNKQEKDKSICMSSGIKLRNTCIRNLAFVDTILSLMR